MALRVVIFTVSVVLLVLAFAGCAATQLPMLCRRAHLNTGEPVTYCKPVPPIEETNSLPAPAKRDPNKPTA